MCLAKAVGMTQVLSQAAITPFGVLKPIRYMVNSTPEFLEVIHTVNGIIGTVSRPEDVEMIQQLATFSTIALPHSQTKFIACFEVPSDLLGHTSSRRALLLNFSEYENKEHLPHIIKKPPHILFGFNVRTLFDINFSLYQFEATLAPTIPQSQWMRVRRSTTIMVSAAESAGAPLRMIISAEANPALPIAQPEN